MFRLPEKNAEWGSVYRESEKNSLVYCQQISFRHSSVLLIYERHKLHIEEISSPIRQMMT
jgi:hypothetical protein